MRRSRYLWYMLLLFLIGCSFGYFILPKNKCTSPNNFLTNQHFIQGLFERSAVNLNDYKEVFDYAFDKLDSDVLVFPTENYFYFNFYVEGKIIRSVIHLPPHSRDSGYIDFGYHQTLDRLKVRNLYTRGVAGGGKLGAKDGVDVKKLSNFKYQVTYKGKKVRFKLNDIKVAPPVKAKLLEDETYVGPSFDESGLAFHLIFNEQLSKLYWILNEDLYVTEHFIKYKDDILIGNRTSFAFYNDTTRQRKILIGANGREVLNNTWYDGPFDQMPDNYVGLKEIEVKKYLEAQYAYYKGKIDEYGQFLHEEDSRIPVANYYVYYELEDLNFVSDCKISSVDEYEFMACITDQVYEVPDNFE